MWCLTPSFASFLRRKGVKRWEQELRLLFVCKITKNIGIVIITPPLKIC